MALLLRYLADDLETQCRIFSLNFNPQRLRLGNKVLRQRLRGPALAAWYPRKTVSFRDLQDAYRPLGLTVFDEYEDDREEAIQMYVIIHTKDKTLIADYASAKLRGKGRPKKKRTAAGMIPIPVRRLLLTSIQNHDRRRRRNRQDHTGVHHVLCGRHPSVIVQSAIRRHTLCKASHCCSDVYISPSLLPRIHFKIFGTSFRLNMKPSHKACLISVALFESAACELLCFEGGVRDWINGVRDLLHIQHPLLPSIHVLVVYVYSLYCMFRKSRFETGHDQFLSLHIYNILMRLFEHIMARDIAKALNPVPKCHGLGSTQTGAKRVKHIGNWNNSM